MQYVTDWIKPTRNHRSPAAPIIDLKDYRKIVLFIPREVPK